MRKPRQRITSGGFPLDTVPSASGQRKRDATRAPTRHGSPWPTLALVQRAPTSDRRLTQQTGVPQCEFPDATNLASERVRPYAGRKVISSTAIQAHYNRLGWRSRLRNVTSRTLLLVRTITERLNIAAPLALASTRWRVQISHFGAVQVRPGVSAFWWRSCLAVPGARVQRVGAPS